MPYRRTPTYDLSDAPRWAREAAANRTALTLQEKAGIALRLQEEHHWPVAKVAALFGISRAGVAYWLASGPEQRERARQHGAEWRDKNRYQITARHRAWRTEQHHGKGAQAAKAALWRAQDGRCYLCQQPLGPDRMAVMEHDHRCCPSNRSCEACRRGLACHPCNTIIGLARDDPDLLELIARNLRPAVAAVTARLAARHNGAPA